MDPSTGESLSAYPMHTTEQALAIAADSHRAQQDWRFVDFSERAGLMQRAAEGLARRRDGLAELMAREMGKPLREGRGEVDKCAWVCRYYAEHAEGFLANREVELDGPRGLVVYRPLGVVLAIMPWNFPLWQVFRFAAPNLMAGNGGLLKHAANVPGCALAIEEIFHDAGFPPELFRTLMISSRQTGPVIASPSVQAVTLTGSTAAGKAVAAHAGELLKKTVLELGGSDPYVILEDADLDLAAEKCTVSRLINSGQSCIAAKRFIAVGAVHDAFVERFRKALAQKRFGSPFEDGNDIGPLARRDLRDELHEQVRQTVAAGARCLLGGEVPPGNGAFYPPTLLVDVPPGSPGYQDELFGPVASVIRATDEHDAVRIANATSFGLGAAVFTADRARGERIASNLLEAGCCFVNDFVRSDPRLPFGGIKESGYGRELGEAGIHEFVNIKSVLVA